MPEFYGSIAGADAYHLSRGNAGWPASPDDGKEEALTRASVWLDGAYYGKWPGTRATADQERSWPRVDASDCEGFAIDPETVPVAIEQATYEAALREFQVPGSMSPDYTPASGVKQEVVGPVSVTYRDGVTDGDYRPVSTTIDDILAPLICGGSSGGGGAGWLMSARA